MAETIKYRSVTRKLRTIFYSVFYGSITQVNNVVYSAAAVLLFSKEHWGEYSQLVISVSLFQTITSWGSREFMASTQALSFRSELARNLTGRLLILLPAAILILLFFRDYPLLSVVFLISKFFSSAYDILIVKERRFFKAFLAEIGLVSIFLLSVFGFRQLFLKDRTYFIILMVAIELLRTIAYKGLLRQSDLTWPGIKTVFDDLRAALPFFGNGLMGFLGSRVDSLMAVFYLGAAGLAVYQVSFNFVFLFQSLANQIFYTYVFHFRRVNIEVKRRVIVNNLLLGILVTIVFFLMMYFICGPVYRLDYGILNYLMLSTMVLLCFWHVPYVYLLYQNNGAKKIVVLTGLSVLAFLCFLLVLSACQMTGTFNTFFYSAFAAQVFRSASFYVAGKRYLTTAI